MSRSEIILADSVFWSKGNQPTQVIHSRNLERLQFDFVTSYLFSDKMLLAASFYFESPLTRSITNQFIDLFKRGDAYCFIDDNLKDYMEHGMRKNVKSPASMKVYSDARIISEYGKQLPLRENCSNRLLRLPPIPRPGPLALPCQMLHLWAATRPCGC